MPPHVEEIWGGLLDNFAKNLYNADDLGIKTMIEQSYAFNDFMKSPFYERWRR